MNTEDLSLRQARDTGLALVLLLLLVAQIWGRHELLPVAIVTLLLTMLWPSLFRLPARLWFGLAAILGTISSTLILSLVFFVVLTPLALLRRALGADLLRRREWRKGQGTLLVTREHTFGPKDLERPF